MQNKLVLIIAAVVSSVGAVPAQAAKTFDSLFVFGDSLVDSGNTGAAYGAGRYSNGFNFADYVSFDLLSGPATAFSFGGRNFAFGGAKAAEFAGDVSPSFAEQIAFLTGSGQSIGSNSLVLVTLGGNDVRGQLAIAAGGGTPTLTPAVTALSSGLTSLIGLGARNIVVTGLPDIGQVPGVTGLGIPALSAAGTQLSFGLNQAFGQTVTGLATQTGYNLQFFDLFAFQSQIYANPAAFGLPGTLNTSQACLAVPGAAPGCNGFVYFDALHPTTQVHRVIANGITAQVTAVPEPATWAMMIGGFGMVGGAMRSARRKQKVSVSYA